MHAEVERAVHRQVVVIGDRGGAVIGLVVDHYVGGERLRHVDGDVDLRLAYVPFRHRNV